VRSDLATALADAFLGGDWTRRGLVDAGAVVLGRRARWLRAMADQVLALYPVAPRDRPRELADVIGTRPAAERVGTARPRVHPCAATRMLSNPWHLPVLHDLGDVALLLGLGQGELAWFADPKSWARDTATEALRHYTATTRRAPSGAVRVLEAPKFRLKALQRRLLAEVLDPIPQHDAAHGFRTGRSVDTYAAPHAGRDFVLRADLESFFAGVTVGRVYGLFRTAGYPEPVAHCLAGLTTTVLPRRTWLLVPHPADPGLIDAHWRLGRRLAAPHLPQGAPTSPALANLAAHRLDRRLAGLAARWDLRYTRYADDLAFSGARGLRAGLPRLLSLVHTIAREEGFRLNDRKTALQTRAGRQTLGGLVVNEHPRPSRAEIDRLRAVLHNCLRDGPRTQNRHEHPDFAAHLAGRVAWVAQHDPVRGARLRAQFDAIDWNR
jgi:hypothetical protein